MATILSIKQADPEQTHNQPECHLARKFAEHRTREMFGTLELPSQLLAIVKPMMTGLRTTDELKCTRMEGLTVELADLTTLVPCLHLLRDQLKLQSIAERLVAMVTTATLTARISEKEVANHYRILDKKLHASTPLPMTAKGKDALRLHVKTAMVHSFAHNMLLHTPTTGEDRFLLLLAIRAICDHISSRMTGIEEELLLTMVEPYLHLQLLHAPLWS